MAGGKANVGFGSEKKMSTLENLTELGISIGVWTIALPIVAYGFIQAATRKEEKYTQTNKHPVYDILK